MNIIFGQIILFLACNHLASVSTQEPDGWGGSKTGSSAQQVCKQNPDFHWNGEKELCLPCTKCHPLGLVTILGCSPTKDTLCGTMQDFRKQMEEQILRREQLEEDQKSSSWHHYRVALGDVPRYPGEKTNNDNEEDEVFGKKVKFTFQNGNKSKHKWSRNQNDGGATHKIRQTVKNLSQRKIEFLRQLQEEENMDHDEDTPEAGEDDIASPSYDAIEGQVKFSDDQSVPEENWIRSGNLHEDLRLIEKELFNGGFQREAAAGSGVNFTKGQKTSHHFSTYITTTTSKMTTTTTTTTTKKPLTFANDIIASTTIRTTSLRPSTTSTVTSTTIPDWLKEDYSNEDEEDNLEDGNLQPDDPPENERFIPSISFDNLGTEDDKDEDDDEIFGAVMKNPTYEEGSGRVPDEFGLLSRILYKNEGRSPQQNGQAKTDHSGLAVTHSLVIVGFLIGFTLVFGVGLIYTKVIRMRPFKLQDNNRAPESSSVGETSLLTSRTSSFLQNSDNRLATFQGHPSPQLASRTVIPSSLETDPPQIISDPNRLPPALSPPENYTSIGETSLLASRPSTSLETDCPRTISKPCAGSGASSPPPNYSNSVHDSYVDRLGRTVLKQMRELPV